MSAPKTVGLPRMRQEESEKRVFMPGFVRALSRLGLAVHVEQGYGERSGLSLSDYRRGSPSVRQCTRAEAFQQDLVFLLRSPHDDEFGLLRPGSCLISMLHYPTRPLRVELLRGGGINAISLDSIENDGGDRLVENMKAVAWNGMEAAFGALRRDHGERLRAGEEPIRVLIIGTGMVGRHAVDAATKLGNIERNLQHMREGGPGVMAIGVGRNLSSGGPALQRLFRQADVLVDATQRSDPSRPVVPNDWIGWLPEHTVVTDLAVDPYTLDADPPVVRGVEGIPQGNLDKYVFRSGDADWDRTVPASIPSRHRRTVATCYSWPGIHPEECMEHYARQLEPMLEPLVRKGYEGISLRGGYFERALYRGTLRSHLAGPPGGE